MLEPVTVPEVFDAILAGAREWEVAPMLRQLAPDDRQSLLCTVCAMRDEIARNCWSTAAEVNALLTTECPLYVRGTATCRF
jgi:hypothetical protein